VSEHPAVVFLRQAHVRAELWATDASRNGESLVVEGGEHWHWECSGHDYEAVPRPGLDEHLSTGQCDCWAMSLRSREEYANRFVSGTLPHIMLRAEEVPPAVAGHIALHDPASVLRRVAAERELLAEHQSTSGLGYVGRDYTEMDSVCTSCGTAGEYAVPWPCRTVLLLAEAWGWTEET
jgi:hypothetical protein